MGFFYQALKKATGVATETEAPEESVQAEAALGHAELSQDVARAVEGLMARPRARHPMILWVA